jgi:hypothetical protein
MNAAEHVPVQENARTTKHLPPLSLRKISKRTLEGRDEPRRWSRPFASHGD